jgi:hypothetical protein
MVVGRGLMVFLVVVVFAVAGCGGSSDSNGATETAASSGGSFSGKPTKKSQFIKEGDAICRKVPTSYQAGLNKLVKKLEKLPKKKREEEETFAAAIPPLRTAVKEFWALGPPKGAEDQAVAIVEALEATADGLEEEPLAPLSGAGSPSEEFSKLTKQFGFTTCPAL